MSALQVGSWEVTRSEEPAKTAESPTAESFGAVQCQS